MTFVVNPPHKAAADQFPGFCALLDAFGRHSILHSVHESASKPLDQSVRDAAASAIQRQARTFLATAETQRRREKFSAMKGQAVRTDAAVVIQKQVRRYFAASQAVRLKKSKGKPNAGWPAFLAAFECQSVLHDVAAKCFVDALQDEAAVKIQAWVRRLFATAATQRQRNVMEDRHSGPLGAILEETSHSWKRLSTAEEAHGEQRIRSAEAVCSLLAGHPSAGFPHGGQTSSTAEGSQFPGYSALLAAFEGPSILHDCCVTSYEDALQDEAAVKIQTGIRRFLARVEMCRLKTASDRSLGEVLQAEVAAEKIQAHIRRYLKTAEVRKFNTQTEDEHAGCSALLATLEGPSILRDVVAKSYEDVLLDEAAFRIPRAVRRLLAVFETSRLAAANEPHPGLSALLTALNGPSILRDVAVKSYEEALQHEAAVFIQKYIRRFLAAVEARRLRQDMAAVVIQKKVRRLQADATVNELRTTLTSQQLGVLQDEAAAAIQRQTRRVWAATEAKWLREERAQREAVVLIQKEVPRLQAAAEMKRLQMQAQPTPLHHDTLQDEAAHAIQKQIRRALAVAQVQQLREERAQYDAAVMIQKEVRRLQAAAAVRRCRIVQAQPRPKSSTDAAGSPTKLHVLTWSERNKNEAAIAGLTRMHRSGGCAGPDFHQKALADFMQLSAASKTRAFVNSETDDCGEYSRDRSDEEVTLGQSKSANGETVLHDPPQARTPRVRQPENKRQHTPPVPWTQEEGFPQLTANADVLLGAQHAVVRRLVCKINDIQDGKGVQRQLQAIARQRHARQCSHRLLSRQMQLQAQVQRVQASLEQQRYEKVLQPGMDPQLLLQGHAARAVQAAYQSAWAQDPEEALPPPVQDLARSCVRKEETERLDVLEEQHREWHSHVMLAMQDNQRRWEQERDVRLQRHTADLQLLQDGMKRMLSSARSSAKSSGRHVLPGQRTASAWRSPGASDTTPPPSQHSSQGDVTQMSHLSFLPRTQWPLRKPRTRGSGLLIMTHDTDSIEEEEALDFDPNTYLWPSGPWEGQRQKALSRIRTNKAAKQVLPVYEWAAQTPIKGLVTIAKDYGRKHQMPSPELLARTEISSAATLNRTTPGISAWGEASDMSCPKRVSSAGPRSHPRGTRMATCTHRDPHSKAVRILTGALLRETTRRRPISASTRILATPLAVDS